MTNLHDGQTGIAEDSGFPDIPEVGYEAYFPTPARQGLIQQLLHLVRYGDGIPVVQGAGRSGKTAIANELTSQLGEVSYLALVEVKSNARLLDVLVEILRQYGFEMGGESSEGELLAELRRFSQVLANDKNSGVLLLDNAHYLDDRSLGALVSLVQGVEAAGHGMHLVFFAQPDLVSRIDELGLLDVSVYDFDIPLLSPSELSDFLKRHQEFRTETSPKLSAETVQAIWSRSRGVPGYSLRLMLETARSTTSISKPLLRNIPVGHMVALSVLGIVLVWALLLRNPDTEQDRTVSELAFTNAQEKPDSMRETASREVFKPTDFQPITPKAATVNPASTLTSNKSVGTVETEKEGKEIKEPLAAPEQNRTDGQVLEIELTPTPQVNKPTQHEHTASVTSEPPQGSVRNSVGENDSFTADEKFLLDQDPSSFTLQVMAASKQEHLVEFVASQENRDSLFLYQGQRGGKAWFIVTAGIYPNRESAAAAITNLPTEQKKGGPWPRQLQNIQGEINDNRHK